MKRWPIIRHVRYWWHRRRCYAWAAHWGELGIGLGYPNESDLDYLERIWRGER